jgi:hypothetical protein
VADNLLGTPATSILRSACDVQTVLLHFEGFFYYTVVSYACKRSNKIEQTTISWFDIVYRKSTTFPCLNKANGQSGLATKKIKIIRIYDYMKLKLSSQ